MKKKRTMTAQQVKKLRSSLGLTQQQWADALRVTRVTVARWEMGDERHPSAIECLAMELMAEKMKQSK